MTLIVKNWEEFQHYKGRNPPWVKVYKKLLDDPEWFVLDGLASKVLVMCWLVASEHEGRLPSVEKLAFRLRMGVKELSSILSTLSHWLEDDASTMLASCKQDACPESESESESEPLSSKEAAAPAAPDARTTLFQDGLARLSRITGRPPNACRNLIGRWLRDADDDAVRVSRAIEDAEINRVAEAVAWITRALKPKTRTPEIILTRKEANKQAVEDVREQLRRYSEEISGSASEPAARIISLAGHGRS